jgi:hypothetical protein
VSSYLEARIAEFEQRARERNDLNFEEVASHLPEDRQARLAALATVMGLDAARALREGISIEQLEQEAEGYRRTAEQMQEEERGENE